MNKGFGDALFRIYDNLVHGKDYGRYIENVKHPYFELVLWKSNDYFLWRHFGESANNATPAELAWIILIIFEMNPLEFEETYTIYKGENENE